MAAAGRDPVDALMEAYQSAFLEEPGLSLERFLERVAAGRHGRFREQDIADFLDAVEAQILANIDTMAEANPQLAPLREERIAETQRMIAALRERFAPGAARER